MKDVIDPVEALRAIAEYQPPNEPGVEPYQEIAVFAKKTARAALEAGWVLVRLDDLKRAHDWLKMPSSFEEAWVAGNLIAAMIAAAKRPRALNPKTRHKQMLRRTPMLTEQRFKIGDPVEVSSTCQYFSDWERQPLWIVAVDLHRDGLSYSVVEEWPPRFDMRADGLAAGVADGWSETDLSPRCSATADARNTDTGDK
jgi:hypothetical protein